MTTPLSTPFARSCATVSLAALLAACAQQPPSMPASGAAGAPQLAPVTARATDGAIHADLKTFQAQQARIKTLNDSGRFPVAGYAMSKAQCWLDVAFHEYSRNDRGGFPQAALEQSFLITESLGGRGTAGAVDPAASTPLVNGATQVRPDLWGSAAALKGHAGFACVAQRVACAEVELVHAGNESNQQQWRHAKPYIQLAEDRLTGAKEAADACVAPPPAAAVQPTPAPTPVAVQQVTTLVNASVVFNFDKRDIKNVRPYSLTQLDGVLAQIKSGQLRAQSVQLVGHADISNGTRQRDYNEKLSRDRVEAVRDHLVAQGVPASIIKTGYEADRVPVVSCTGKARSRTDREECLLPNRRVQVVITGSPAR